MNARDFFERATVLIVVQSPDGVGLHPSEHRLNAGNVGEFNLVRIEAHCSGGILYRR